MGLIALTADDLDFADAWIDGQEDARWRSASGHAPEGDVRASGSSVIEVPEGCRLPRHTDSAEETVVVHQGVAEVEVAGERRQVTAGGLAVIPQDAPHEVRNAGEGPLRFVAVYAGPDVVTRYQDEVQPDGSRERHTVN
ncbi:MAG TPA: cupin domain-containing protein [Baekduia sp.]|nr:cupin domain-containing protein [Baekduia sp.]